MLFGKEIICDFDISNYYVLYTKDNLTALLKEPCLYLYNGNTIRYVSFEILQLYQPYMVETSTNDLFKAINIPPDIYKELNTLHIISYNMYLEDGMLTILSDAFQLIGHINYLFLEGLVEAFIKYSNGELLLKRLGDYK